jgi:hypothetical protein
MELHFFLCFAFFPLSSSPLPLYFSREKEKKTTNTNIEFDDGHYQDYLT